MLKKMKYQLQFRFEDFRPINDDGDTCIYIDGDTIEECLELGPKDVPYIKLERVAEGYICIGFGE